MVAVVVASHMHINPCSSKWFKLFFLAIMCSLLYLRFVIFVARAMCFYFISPVPSEQRVGGGEGGGVPNFPFLFSFLCSANHERDWPLLCDKVVLSSGWQPIR